MALSPERDQTPESLVSLGMYPGSGSSGCVWDEFSLRNKMTDILLKYKKSPGDKGLKSHSKISVWMR